MSTDPHAIDLNELVVNAGMFRLKQADSTVGDSITISRDVFDKLFAVLTAAASANSLPGISVSLARQNDHWQATGTDSPVGDLTASGRTVLEALGKLVLEWQYAVDRRIS